VVEVPRKLPGRLRLGWPSIVVLGVAIALAVAGYVIALGEVRDREERLLREQATQTAAIIGSFARQIEAILYAGSVVADVTGGDPATFASRMSERLEGTAISSITLLSLGSSGPTVLADAGTSPLLVSGFDPYDQERLEEIAASGDLRVVKIATVEAGKVVGFAASGGRGNLAVYAESVVPALDNIFLFRPAKGSDYALYLGSSQSSETLLASSTDDLPLEGTTVTQELDLGDETGLIVVGAAGGLVGGLTRWAPWVTVVAVALLAVGVALVLELRRRRQSSEAATRALAEQNERLREVDRL
jgi:hypothetical protein